MCFSRHVRFAWAPAALLANGPENIYTHRSDLGAEAPPASLQRPLRPPCSGAAERGAVLLQRNKNKIVLRTTAGRVDMDVAGLHSGRGKALQLQLEPEIKGGSPHFLLHLLTYYRCPLAHDRIHWNNPVKCECLLDSTLLSSIGFETIYDRTQKRQNKLDPRKS